MQATIIGNITDDPELRFTPSGLAVANFTVAENHRRFNRQTNEWEDIGTSWYRCSIWREPAENVVESLAKGTRVIVHGEVRQNEYERRDGSKGMAVNLDVAEIGPALKYATAKVTKVQRNNGQQQRPPQGQQQGGGDPWGQPQGHQQQGGDPWGSSRDEPPF